MRIVDLGEDKVLVDNIILEHPKLTSKQVYAILGYMHTQLIDLPSVYHDSAGEVNLTQLAEQAGDEYYTELNEAPEFLFELAFIAVNTVHTGPSGLDEVVYE